MAPKKIPARERFFKFVRQMENGCWLWMGALRGGRPPHHMYGAFTDENGKLVQAHLWAYEHLRGLPLTPGLLRDHVVCQTPACANPWHLEEVTPRANTLRSSLAPAAINARKVMCLRGHSLSGDNLYIDPRGKRNCRQCAREAEMRRRKQVVNAKHRGHSENG